jgi:acyl transferase domain-containing protein/NADPH:quinone reductase-like Zn-dependent oxidoreductase/NADP-dependent 3-hydroxy acid dehydrogenase YdfG/acyl carrier protein
MSHVRNEHAQPPRGVGANEPVAVVGMACRFPGGANDPDAYWALLRAGYDAVTEVPRDRWDVDAYYDPDPDAPGKMATRWGAFVDGVDLFDADFFRISPREAAAMDPQQRLFLEVCWHALEDAGCRIDALAGTSTGVFAGISNNDYLQLTVKRNDTTILEPHTGTGNAFSTFAGRVSYVLGLRGPSMAIDTACSSSLVAAHLACRALRAGECDLALAGGVNTMHSPEPTCNYSRARMLSTDGRCHTFDAAANGYVRGEGSGAVVLKRLSDARRDGDRIHAVIRGTAVNHNGRSNGLTAPSGVAQEAVIRAALANGGVDASTVGFVEAHGTGTPLGDPIEMRALGRVFATRDTPLFVTSGKTNHGHLESAAGIAGLIKAVLSLRHGEIPPHRNLVSPSAYIAWDELAVRVPSELTPWPAAASAPRRAGVSSFGFGGTNAHAVLEAAPEPVYAEGVGTAGKTGADTVPAQRYEILTLSAHTEGARAGLARAYAEQLRSGEAQLADICFSANTGRAPLQHRAVVTARSREEAAGALDALARGDSPADAQTGVAEAVPDIVFLFTGQGAQYAGMGRELYDGEPVFRAALDRCAELLREHGVPLIDLLYGERGMQLDQTMYTQPALFALEFALAELWASWGVEPAAVLGHSAGEYVAACVAGVLDLEDGLRLISARGRLMQSLPLNGAMAAVRADPERVEPLLSGPVAIAALNAPGETVISGERAAVDAVCRKLEAAGITAMPLRVSHAFHSPLMDPILDEFERIAGECALRAPQLRLLSNVTGTWANGELTSPAYWRRHLREPVRFAQSLRHAADEGHRIFVELGPQPTLSALGARVVPDARWLPSLRRGRSERQTLLQSAGALWIGGVEVDWRAVHGERAQRRVALPLYPFQRERFWIESPPALDGPRAVSRGRAAELHPLLGARLSSALSTLQFEGELGTASAPYLDDHRVFGKILFPATGYVELALAAAHALWDGRPVCVENVSIERPIVLEPGVPGIVQTIVERDGADAASVRLFVRENAALGETWNAHGSARLRALNDGAETDDADAGALIDARARCAEPVDVTEHYAQLRERGLEYGPAFRGIVELWRGDREALARIALPDAVQRGATRYHAHPALLDAALHAIGAALERSGNAHTYVPVGIQRAAVHAGGITSGWALARVRDGGPERGIALADVDVFDDDGQLAIELRGVRLQRMLRSAWHDERAKARANDSIHRVTWQPKPRPDGVLAAGGAWLILADAAGTGAALAERLERHGCSAQLLYANDADDASDADGANDAVARFGEIVASRTWSGVVHLWSLDADAAPERAEERIVNGAIALVTALAARARAPRPPLWLVTRGAQDAGAQNAGAQDTGSHSAAGLLGAPLWGLGTVVALEHPELPCLRVDLDATGAAGAGALFDELAARDGEDCIALRDGTRYAARLETRALEASPSERRSRDETPQRLEITERGTFDNLRLVPMRRRAPGPGEVEIAVRATGLNFRDVLGVLGLYPGDPGPLGSECAGTVVAVGPGVAEFAAGDDVIAVAAGSFASYAIADVPTTWRKPPNISFAEAAAIPVAFLTAYHGLHEVARIGPGTRVLIHSGAGGVGLAAVQLALRAGAEVYATASAPKWDAVRATGAQHVYDSRSLEFAERIAADTGGRGVDVVLNSFGGDYIERSLALLVQGGTFLEIGKREIWSEERMRAARPDVQYDVYDLAHDLRERMGLHAMLDEILGAFASGELRPPAITDFAVDAAPKAFRYMAQAKHVGKIVLHQPGDDATAERPLLQADRTYVISGAFGALGTLVADWMLDNGAHSLLLLGRTQSDAVRATLERLRARCAGVDAAFVDLLDASALRRVLRERAGKPPLGGIVHAAGTVDDAFLEQLDPERVARVMAPKVTGTRNLHELTLDEPLDFFVLFSSISSVFGSPGQANYASANAFADAFARYRRSLGLPATAINWGPWEGAGMAASLDRRAARGVRWIDPAFGLETLGALLRSGAQRDVVVMPVAWPEFLAQFPAGGVPPLFADLANANAAAAAPGPPSAAADSGFLAELQAAPPKRRRSLAIAHISQSVAAVLGLGDASAVDPRHGLTTLGMDSLMAVELRSRLQGAFGRALPATLAFEHPTIEAIADYLLGETFPAENDAPVHAEEALPVVETVSGDDLDALSEDELARLLESKLERLQPGS